MDRWFASPKTAAEEGIKGGEASRLVRLAFLGRDVIEAVLRGDPRVCASASALR